MLKIISSRKLPHIGKLAMNMSIMRGWVERSVTLSLAKKSWVKCKEG